jgi:hypothetical protein
MNPIDWLGGMTVCINNGDHAGMTLAPFMLHAAAPPAGAGKDGCAGGSCTVGVVHSPHSDGIL